MLNGGGELVLPVQKDLVMHTDIVFFDEVMLLVSVAKPINMAMCTDLKDSKSAGSVKAALLEQIGLLKSRGFIVHSVQTDGESVFGAKGTKLDGVPIQQAAAGAHEPVVERCVRLIKERCRSVVSDLPFAVPKSLVKYLVGFVVNRVNCTVRKSGTAVSAREAYRGIKLDYRVDVGLSFCDYCQVHADSSTISKSRVIDAIALSPLDDKRGGWRFLNLDTFEPVTSHNFTLFPTPDSVVNAMNKKAFDEAKRFREKRGNRGDRQRDLGTIVPVPGVMQVKPDHSPNLSGLGGDSSGAVVSSDTPGAELGGESVGAESGDLSESGHGDQEAASECSVQFAFLQLSMKKGLHKHGDVATEAIAAELKQMIDKRVWRPLSPNEVTRDMRNKSIRCFMFMKEKYGPEGEMIKLKARLVAGGNMQDGESIYGKSSPTVHCEDQFMVYAIAASERRYFQSADVVGAFLDCDMEGDTVIVMLDGQMLDILLGMEPTYREYVDHKGRLWVVLLKAMYGCVQSAYLFYKKLKGVLLDLGFVENAVSECVFNTIVDGSQCTVTFHVDDLFISHRSDESITKVVDAIAEGFSGVQRQTGSSFQHLGVQLDRSDYGDITMSMQQYTDGCVEAWGPRRGATTPATAEMFNIDDNATVLNGDAKGAFHTGVAKLLYLAKRTRPDILTAISFLAGRVNSPTEEDWEKLDRVYGYLSVKSASGVKFSGGADIDVECYADAAFMAHDDCKSRTGGCVRVCGGVVATVSTRQKIVTKSSTESELVALCQMATVTLNCRAFLEAQGIPLKTSKVYQDNKSVLDLMRAGKPTSSNTKHIKMRYFFVKQHVESGELELVWCGTKDMLADLFTKPLVGELFQRGKEAVVYVMQE